MTQLSYIFFVFFISLSIFSKDIELDKFQDLGELKPNQKVEVFFKGKNTSSKTINITKIKTSCTCMTAGVKKLSVQEGDAFRIPNQFSTGSMPGKVNKTVSLTIEGYKFPVLLRMTAIVDELEKTDAYKNVKKLRPQQTCPYKGTPIDSKLFYSYKDKKIYVCCQPCLQVVQKNPEEALARLRDLYGEKLQ
jgi:hypothetical protein